MEIQIKLWKKTVGTVNVRLGTKYTGTFSLLLPYPLHITSGCCLGQKSKNFQYFIFRYVSPSHVLIRDVTTEQRTSLLSRKGLPIDEIKVVVWKKLCWLKVENYDNYLAGILCILVILFRATRDTIGIPSQMVLSL